MTRVACFHRKLQGMKRERRSCFIHLHHPSVVSCTSGCRADYKAMCLMSPLETNSSGFRKEAKMLTKTAGISGHTRVPLGVSPHNNAISVCEVKSGRLTPAEFIVFDTDCFLSILRSHLPELKQLGQIFPPPAATVSSLFFTRAWFT